MTIRDAKDDGQAALLVPRQHYARSSKPRIASLCTWLTSSRKANDESVTDYNILSETAVAALKEAEETTSDSLLIVMVLKGLPSSYQPFVVMVTMT